MNGRFALLLHTHPREHYDLVMDQPESDELATWRISNEIIPNFTSLHARKIFDHRRAYLTYEGEVSNNRGRVKRIDEGTIVAHRWTPDSIDITMSGSLISGRFKLSLIAHDNWRIARLDVPHATD
jgi:hypothetical protein